MLRAAYTAERTPDPEVLKGFFREKLLCKAYRSGMMFEEYIELELKDLEKRQKAAKAERDRIEAEAKEKAAAEVQALEDARRAEERAHQESLGIANRAHEAQKAILRPSAAIPGHSKSWTIVVGAFSFLIVIALVGLLVATSDYLTLLVPRAVVVSLGMGGILFSPFAPIIGSRVFKRSRNSRAKSPTRERPS
jgi:hypothetical protein